MMVVARSGSSALDGLWRRVGYLHGRWRLGVLLGLQRFSDGQPQGVLYEGETNEQPFGGYEAPDVSQSSSRPPIAPAGQAMRAFEAFFRQHERQVVAYLWRMTGDEQVAHDLSQETFIRAWRHFARIGSYEQPGAWLLRVATNLALTWLRGSGGSGAAANRFSSDEEPARSDPARHFVERDLVQRTLLELTPQQRASLVLREVYGFSCEEIGQTLGISRGAVKMALLRGREQFRARYLRSSTPDDSGRGRNLGYERYGQRQGQGQEGRR